jgi:serine protease DegQ
MVTIVAQQLERFGKVRRGRIGVSVQSVTSDIAAGGGLPQVAGAIIGSLERNSPAGRAQIRRCDRGDRHRLVMSASDVRNRIGLREGGSSVVITYLRQGRRQNVTLMTVPFE